MSKYFTDKELACKCGCGTLPKPEFQVFLDSLRESCGFPLILNSAARCAKHNAEVSQTGSDSGPHVLLVAADIRCYGAQALVVLQKALLLGATGIGISQKLGTALASRYLHVDIVELNHPGVPRPNIWSY